jgi:predicted NBD/HSP70 family sugar kinase
VTRLQKGEKWMGAGRNWRNFLCLTLGTGVVSGLILDGELWYGSQASGPEFGHITIIPNGVSSIFWGWKG